jgi:hypothetical protein
MIELTKQPMYFVVQCSLKYRSFEEAKARAPHEIAELIYC